MEPGVYESLLTARLHQVLAAHAELVPDLQDLDDAEQPLAIARHLAGLIERGNRQMKGIAAEINHGQRRLRLKTRSDWNGLNPLTSLFYDCRPFLLSAALYVSNHAVWLCHMEVI